MTTENSQNNGQPIETAMDVAFKLSWMATVLWAIFEVAIIMAARYMNHRTT